MGFEPYTGRIEPGAIRWNRMQFSKEDLDELRVIMREERGKEITEGEAQEIGSRVVELLRLLSQPLPARTPRKTLE